MLVTTCTTTYTNTRMAKWHILISKLSTLSIYLVYFWRTDKMNPMFPKKYLYLRGLYRRTRGTSWSWPYGYI